MSNFESFYLFRFPFQTTGISTQSFQNCPYNKLLYLLTEVRCGLKVQNPENICPFQKSLCFRQERFHFKLNQVYYTVWKLQRLRVNSV